MDFYRYLCLTILILVLNVSIITAFHSDLACGESTNATASSIEFEEELKEDKNCSLHIVAPAGYNITLAFWEVNLTTNCVADSLILVSVGAVNNTYTLCGYMTTTFVDLSGLTIGPVSSKCILTSNHVVLEYESFWTSSASAFEPYPSSNVLVSIPNTWESNFSVDFARVKLSPSTGLPINPPSFSHAPACSSYMVVEGNNVIDYTTKAIATTTSAPGVTPTRGLVNIFEVDFVISKGLTWDNSYGIQSTANYFNLTTIMWKFFNQSASNSSQLNNVWFATDLISYSTPEELDLVLGFEVYLTAYLDSNATKTAITTEWLKPLVLASFQRVAPSYGWTIDTSHFVLFEWGTATQAASTTPDSLSILLSNITTSIGVIFSAAVAIIAFIAIVCYVRYFCYDRNSHRSFQSSADVQYMNGNSTNGGGAVYRHRHAGYSLFEDEPDVQFYGSTIGNSGMASGGNISQYNKPFSRSSEREDAPGADVGMGSENGVQEHVRMKGNGEKGFALNTEGQVGPSGDIAVPTSEEGRFLQKWTTYPSGNTGSQSTPGSNLELVSGRI